MENHQKKRFKKFTKSIDKINKQSYKDLNKCMYASCKNIPSEKEFKKMDNEYKKKLKKECKKGPNYYKCFLDIYNKSGIKEMDDIMNECKNKYCDYHLKIISLNSNKVVIEDNKEKLNRFNCIKEYLESNDTSSKNKAKFVKKGNFLGNKEFDHMLEKKENDLKKVKEHIKELEKIHSMIIKRTKNLETELNKNSIKKSSKKSSKKSTMKSSKKSTKKSSKKSIKK